MIEVEAKAKIENPEKYRALAGKLGRYKGKERKVDDYYTLEMLHRYPRKSLRIRKLHGHYEINFKQRLSYVKGIHAKKEVEFRVSDISGFLALISDFGFKKWLRKEKESEVYEINKNFHIEINNVKSLGWFVEVEYLCDKAEINKARNKVLEIVEKLGLKKKNIVGAGYTKLLWDKRR